MRQSDTDRLFVYTEALPDKFRTTGPKLTSEAVAQNLRAYPQWTVSVDVQCALLLLDSCCHTSALSEPVYSQPREKQLKHNLQTIAGPPEAVFDWPGHTIAGPLFLYDIAGAHNLLSGKDANKLVP